MGIKRGEFGIKKWPVYLPGQLQKWIFWGSDDPVRTGAGNFANWDWLSCGLLNSPSLFRPVFLGFLLLFLTLVLS